MAGSLDNAGAYEAALGLERRVAPAKGGGGYSPEFLALLDRDVSPFFPRSSFACSSRSNSPNCWATASYSLPISRNSEGVEPLVKLNEYSVY